MVRKRVDSTRDPRISSKDARERLEAIAEFLEQQAGPYDDVIRWGASCIRQFLKDEMSSMDRAFSLTAPRGAPERKTADHLRMVRDYMESGENQEATMAKHGRIDEREFERLVKRYCNAAYAAILAERLSAKGRRRG
jgi:hypothetical protein